MSIKLRRITSGGQIKGSKVGDFTQEPFSRGIRMSGRKGRPVRAAAGVARRDGKSATHRVDRPAGRPMHCRRKAVDYRLTARVIFLDRSDQQEYIIYEKNKQLLGPFSKSLVHCRE